MLVLVKNSYEETIQAGVKVPGSDLILKPGDAFVPQPEHAYQPLTFRDTVTALRARKVCKWKETNETDGGHFEITGIDRRSKNWQIPYLRCDSRKCTQVGQEASSFCEVSVLALAGKNREGAVRAAAFRDWVLQRYPALVTSNATMILRYFDYLDENESSSSSNFYYSNKAIDDYVSSLGYGTSPDRPKISMAIVFDGNDPDAFLYALRPNSTNYNIPEDEGDVDGVSRTMPNTNYLIDSRASSDFETCVATKASNSIRERDLGALGKSCTGQYLYNGVLAAQRLVQDYALALSGAADAGYSVAEAGVQFVQFPMASYNPPGFFVENIITPVLLSLGLLLSVASMIAYIVQEKELRQKELLKMMSVTEVEIEWSWFLTFMLHNLIAATLCTLVSSFLFPNSSFGWLWIFWTLTFLSLTWFCTALAACCTQATRGVFFGLLCFFGGLLPSIVFFISTNPPWLIFIIMLHPIATFSYGISMIGGLEDLTLGLTTQSVPYVHELLGYSFQKILLQFIYSCILWSFLTWYWNRTARLEFGQAPLPRNFPLTKAYWRSVFWPQAHALELAKGAAESTASSTIASSVSSYSDDHADASEKSRIPMEPVPDALRKQSQMGESIEIRNLHKSFGDKVAVNGLNLSLYNGQITALLGHNGAGKTTTINLLTGAVAPTSGTALVAGKDIRTQMGEIRRDIGICMQHDCLFPRLTVREHVEFYSRLKGLYEEMEKDEADKLVDQSIEDVALWDKRDTFSSNLSGGMKRKLSLAIAFCGGSKVVVLDEPTSGMDPFSRRFTWNVIRHYRQNRIIILTTHFMDEADILGDRIAIMSEGKLSCVGSSLFLKKAFGFGYQLTIEKNQVVGHPPHGGVSQEVVQLENGSKVIAQSASGGIEVSNEQLGNSVARPRTDTGDSFTRANRAVYACTKDLKKIITHYIPEAKLLSDVGSELSYQLPLGSSSQFTAMFEKLDEHVDKKSISCYGVSITTLDEVFLMVTRGDRPKKTAFASSRLGSSEMSTTFESANFDQSSLSGLVLDEKITFMRHLKTLLKKRAAIFKRDRRAWIFTTIVPSCFVLVGFFLVKFVTKDPALVPLTLRLADLNPNVPAGLVQNPIPVNSPESPFMCQAPTCSHRTPFIREELTNETYFFCGFQAKLGISYSGYSPTNNTCVVSEPLNIVDTLTDGGAVSEEAVVSNVAQVS
jgi:ATP-binding cassette, subfamily A (ABC1), member 3